MSIAAVHTHRVSAALHTPLVTSLRRATSTDSLIVAITDGDGRTGYGEAPQVWQVSGSSVAGAESCVATMFAPLLFGRDADDVSATAKAVRSAVAGNEAAKAAVDVALHDLAAQRLGVPLARMLGGCAGLVPTDVTLAAGEPDSLANAARARVKDGFSVVKVKVGTADAASEIARVRAIRDAVGPEVTIRLDANQGWTPREAVRVIRGVEDAHLGVELVEQPVARWDIDGLAWVSDRVDLPILADEAVFSVRDLVQVIRRRAADMVNVKLAKCGGLTPARTLLTLAEEHGMGTVVGCMMETTVGVSAAAHLVAAHGTTAVSDLDSAWWIADSPIVGGASYERARVKLSAAPGLGVLGLNQRADTCS